MYYYYYNTITTTLMLSQEIIIPQYFTRNNWTQNKTSASKIRDY